MRYLPLVLFALAMTTLLALLRAAGVPIWALIAVLCVFAVSLAVVPPRK